MHSLSDLLKNNKEWAKSIEAAKPGFFKSLVAQQNPKFLWIGCSDSRVPANEIVGLEPGEVFVHRNVANQVLTGDLNCLSAVDYAVKSLKVKHVIVTGHYGCGGIKASVKNTSLDLVDSWLGQARDCYLYYKNRLDGLEQEHMLDILVDINVLRQVRSLCRFRDAQGAQSRVHAATCTQFILTISLEIRSRLLRTSRS